MLELRHNMELTMAEWQAVWDLDRTREIEDVQRKKEEEKKASIDETKKKQWCSQCLKVWYVEYLVLVKISRQN